MAGGGNEVLVFMFGVMILPMIFLGLFFRFATLLLLPVALYIVLIIAFFVLLHFLI